DDEQLKTLFKETIYLLYRLLFILYAESRDLLPVGESQIYRDTYSLEHLREIAERREIKPEDYDKTYYIQTLRTLFTLLHNGHPLLRSGCPLLRSGCPLLRSGCPLRNPTVEDATTRTGASPVPTKQTVAPF